MILEPKKTKSVTVSTFSQPICHDVIEPDAMILGFWMLSFKPGFHSLTPIKRLWFLFTFCHYSGTICIYNIVYLPLVFPIYLLFHGLPSLKSKISSCLVTSLQIYCFLFRCYRNPKFKPTLWVTHHQIVSCIYSEYMHL